MYKLKLPKKSELQNTRSDGEDPFDHYYGHFIGYVYKKRLKLCLELIKDKKFDAILDIGYGSGIFFPTLKNIGHKLYGLDEHQFSKEVSESLKKLGIQTNLISADLKKMPYGNEKFDAIISISTYEHIKNEDLEIAIEELNRVLKKGGAIYIGVPVKNKLTDIFLDSVGDHLPVNEMHPSSHRDIIQALKKKFKVNKILTFPKFLPINYSFYVVIEAVKC